MTRTALVTGITGQDGAYLARLLIEKGYRVLGGIRRSSTANLWRLAELGIEREVELVPFELIEASNMRSVLERRRPDEIYNLAAQSFVGVSFDQPSYTAEVDGMGVLKLLDAMRSVLPEARFYQASTSEMFGNVDACPQDETTAFQPRSPYGVAKLFAHWMTVNYREAHGLFCVSGILFNHESPLRGPEFLTRKVTIGLARLAAGGGEPLRLGNLDARRDWGFAGDYVEGMWRMLARDAPGDYVLATGATSSVRAFFDLAAEAAGFRPEWTGDGPAAVARDGRTGRVLAEIDPGFYRPAEVNLLQGDASRAAAELGWQPKTDLAGLVAMMVEADLRRAHDRA